jgi:hypothetical protein
LKLTGHIPASLKAYLIVVSLKVVARMASRSLKKELRESCIHSSNYIHNRFFVPVFLNPKDPYIERLEDIGHMREIDNW